MTKRIIPLIFALAAISISSHAVHVTDLGVFDYIRALNEEVEKEWGRFREKASYYKPFTKTMEAYYNKEHTKYIVEAALPGYERKNIQVEIVPESKKNMLLITAEEESASDEKEGTTEKTEQTAKSAKIVKSLPDDVNIKSCDWFYKNGMVIITCNVEKEKKQKKLSVPYKK